MAAGKYNITIEQGATFALTITAYDGENESGNEINLTGYSARMKIAEAPGQTAILSLTSGAGLTLGGAAGTIAILIAATATDDLTFDNGVYDLEIVSGGGVVTRLLEGEVWLSKEVTIA